MTEKTGKCMCGAVKFTVAEPPCEFNSCYCDMCKRWTGSRFVAISVPADSVKITGSDAISTITSSEWAERAFCNRCGSGLWYKMTEGPMKGALGLSVGLLDDTDDMKLVREFYVDRKNCVYEFPEDRIQMTEAEVIAMFAPSEEGEPK